MNQTPSHDVLRRALPRLSIRARNLFSMLYDEETFVPRTRIQEELQTTNQGLSVVMGHINSQLMQAGGQ